MVTDMDIRQRVRQALQHVRELRCWLDAPENNLPDYSQSLALLEILGEDWLASRSLNAQESTSIHTC
jgi:hypothetical protein